MKYVRKIIALSISLFVGFSGYATVITNGSFEDGLNGYDKQSRPIEVTVRDSTFGGESATDGNWLAELSVEDKRGDLTSSFSYLAKSGFTYKAGDVLSFNWAYYANFIDGAPGYAAFSVKDSITGNGIFTNVLAETHAADFFNAYFVVDAANPYVSWQTVKMKFTQSGVGQLTFINNSYFGESFGSSAPTWSSLYIDNIQLTSKVPEPAPLILMALGLLMIVSRKFSKK